QAKEPLEIASVVEISLVADDANAELACHIGGTVLAEVISHHDVRLELVGDGLVRLRQRALGVVREHHDEWLHLRSRAIAGMSRGCNAGGYDRSDLRGGHC